MTFNRSHLNTEYPYIWGKLHFLFYQCRAIFCLVLCEIIPSSGRRMVFLTWLQTVILLVVIWPLRLWQNGLSVLICYPVFDVLQSVVSALSVRQIVCIIFTWNRNCKKSQSKVEITEMLATLALFVVIVWTRDCHGQKGPEQFELNNRILSWMCRLNIYNRAIIFRLTLYVVRTGCRRIYGGHSVISAWRKYAACSVPT